METMLLDFKWSIPVEFEKKIVDKAEQLKLSLIKNEEFKTYINETLKQRIYLHLNLSDIKIKFFGSEYMALDILEFLGEHLPALKHHLLKNLKCFEKAFEELEKFLIRGKMNPTRNMKIMDYKLCEAIIEVLGINEYERPYEIK